MKLPQSLELALRERKLIPFVGAGLSQGVTDPSGEPLFPSWSGLLKDAATSLSAEGKDVPARLVGSLVDADDLLDAARRAQTELGNARWLRFLKSKFDKVYEEADPASLNILRLVWSLGSNLVITTNYDRTLQWTCPDRADFRVWDIEAKAEQVNAMREGTTARPTVWHLHGQIDNANELVITPGGYTKLYGSTEPPKYAAALDTLRSILKTHTLLFLGFSMSDADFMAQVTGVTDLYDGVASQHFALLRRGQGDAEAMRRVGVEPLYYEEHVDVEQILSSMSLHTLQSLPTHVRSSRYIVDRNEGLYLFGGRGDAFFQLYDEALLGIQSQLDIFSLKLSRFRKQHTETLLNAASKTRIRIALLDPAFPLPADHVSLASLREQEERSPVGAIRRDVAEWADLVAEYRKRVDRHQIVVAPGKGLEVRLYNILPTVNLFRVDTNLFVGPYLLDVEDRETPTFLIKSEAPGRGSMGSTMFNVYNRHFDAVWSNERTRSIEEVSSDEIAHWREGRGAAKR